MSLIGIIIIAVIGGLAGIGGLTVYLILRRRGEGNRDSGVAPANPVSDAEKLLDGLVGLNLDLRVEAAPSEVTNKSEEIIDDIMDLLPRANADYRGTELTFMVNKLASEYLPNLIRPYLELTPQTRDGHTQGALESLGVISEEIDQMKRQIESQSVNDYKTQEKFTQYKFSSGVRA